MAMKTPGVYIVEKDAFPKSIVPAPTAVPAFVGYTQKAVNGAKSIKNVPFRITSMLEYHQHFGDAVMGYKVIDTPTGTKQGVNQNSKKNEKKTPESLNDAVNSGGDFSHYDISYSFVYQNEFTLYHHMLLFFANGGESCYIVSVGDGDEPLIKTNLEKGIEALEKEQEPTMLVIPEAVNLAKEDCYAVYTKATAHCGSMKNRIAILDIPDGFKAREKGNDVIEAFRENIGGKHLNYASAYYPWLTVSPIERKTPDEKNINLRIDQTIFLSAAYKKHMAEKDDNAHQLRRFFLEAEYNRIENDKSITEKQKVKDAVCLPIAKADPKTVEEAKKGKADGTEPTDPEYLNAAQKILTALNKNEKETLSNKLFLDKKQLLDKLKIKLAKPQPEPLPQFPPSAIMAGIYTRIDKTRGVWKSPANLSVCGIIAPTVNLSDEEQKDLNMPQDGKAVNAIRFFRAREVKSGEHVPWTEIHRTGSSLMYAAL